MDEILRQLGGLLLGSIPTIILVVLLFAIYNVVVHKLLVKILAERHAKTEGAIEKARAEIAAAEARTAVYEQRLREARMALFKSQESRRQAALQARAAALVQAQARAQTQLKQAQAVIEHEKQAVQAGLQSEIGRLASEIIRTVLRPAMAPSQAGGQ